MTNNMIRRYREEEYKNMDGEDEKKCNGEDLDADENKIVNRY